MISSMKKYLLFIFFCMIAGFAHAQVNTIIEWHTGNASDTIFYDPSNKLEWDDFRGRPVRTSIAAAITESGFGYKLAMKTSGRKTNIIITIVCFFNRTGSWVKPKMASDYALVHEQHHFDLTYIAARLFYEKLKAARFTADNCAALVEKINDDCYKELDRMQNEYDGQTQNGRLRNVQADWNKKIDLQLESLAIN